MSPSPTPPPAPRTDDRASTSTRRRNRAVLALLVLSPGIAEYMTGSSPVTAFAFNPPGFLLQLLLNLPLYGGGVLLIREVCVARQKGWASVLLLGAAYGIVEEGFAVHTFFQTRGNPVGVLGSYGHVWGTNWVWAVGLATFHAVYSIALPILLVQLLYPEWATQRVTTNRGLAFAGGAYLVDVVFLDAIAPSKPALGPFLFFVGVVGLLVYAALRAPGDLLTSRVPAPDWRPTRFVLLGLVFFPLWIFTSAFAPALRLPPVAAIAIFLGVLAATGTAVVRHGGVRSNEVAKLALAGGLLGALLPWELLLDLGQNPGVVLVAALAIVLLLYLRRQIARRTVVVPSGASEPPLGLGEASEPFG